MNKKTSEEIKIEYDKLQKRFVDIHINKETNFTDSNKFFELKNKKWIDAQLVKEAILRNFIDDKFRKQLLKELGLE